MKPRLPDAVLAEVLNFTGYPHQQYRNMVKGARFVDVVAVSASFILQNGRVKPAGRHRGLLYEDRSHGDTLAHSSLACAQEDLPYKPKADVYVTGTVQSPHGKPSRRWAGLLWVVRPCVYEGRTHGEKFATLIKKPLDFSGPRQWDERFFGWALTDPEPASRVPLRYELAYGGYRFTGQKPDEAGDDTCYEYHPHNPSGSGYFGPSFEIEGLRAGRRTPRPGPQISHEGEQLGKAYALFRPAGWGPIQRFWAPRVKMQGAYNKAWLRQAGASALPDYPADFNDEYFQYAPADQQISGYLWGDEAIGLTGVFADREGIYAQLPGQWLQAAGIDGRGEAFASWMNLDTAHIDLDARQIHLTWRLSLDQSHGVRVLTLSRRQDVGAWLRWKEAPSTDELLLRPPGELYHAGMQAHNGPDVSEED